MNLLKILNKILQNTEDILKKIKPEPIEIKRKVTVVSHVHKDLYLTFQDNGSDETLVTIYPNKKYSNSELINEDKSLSAEFGPIIY